MQKYIIHIEDKKESEPREHEKRAARIVADHFKSDIIFLRRASSKTPDLYVLRTNVRWELKAPLGGSKHTIQNNLRDTDGQSENVILDLSRAKLTDAQGTSRAKECLRTDRSRIRRLKIITKGKKIVDIKGG